MRHSALIDARTAALRLGISRATLYAYVSRGLVAALPDPDDPRQRRYRAADVAALAAAKARGRRPGAIAAAALDWGVPALSSRIALIERGRLFYRGIDALRLAEGASLEDAARLLWDCGDSDPFGDAAVPDIVFPPDPPVTDAAPFDRGRARFAWAEGAAGEGGVQAAADAARHLRLLAACMLARSPGPHPIHGQVAATWSLSPAMADLVRMALVLLAEHELNVSAFAVRVVASSGARLGACLSAGLAALSGSRHGGATAAAEMLFAEAAGQGAMAAVADRLRRDGALPAFGHPLYPDGDPRAALLLGRLPPDPLRQALIEAVAVTLGQPPNIDFALAALGRALSLPPGAGQVLFAVARSVGWIAHAMEQRAEGRLIRPRAEYCGVRPGAAAAAPD